MKRSTKILPILLVSFILVLAFSTVAFAAKPDLEYVPKQVYFADDGRLLIQGYFINHSDRTITHLDQIDFKVDVKNSGESYQRLAVFTVRDQNVYLRPGETVNWYFWTRNAEYREFEYWHVKWYAYWRYGD